MAQMFDSVPAVRMDRKETGSGISSVTVTLQDLIKNDMSFVERYEIRLNTGYGTLMTVERMLYTEISRPPGQSRKAAGMTFFPVVFRACRHWA